MGAGVGDRCLVFGELASGGMATVYLGKLQGAAGFSRRVAIKSLHAHYAKDPDFLAMFLDEARLSGRIQHPNAVRVLDVLSSGAELQLVMEYIDGESLSKLLRLVRARGERVPVSIAVAVMIGVLEGLHAAHEACGEDGTALQIVHRDVSPQNVLVGVDGMARILDFGIAKAVGRMQTTRNDQLKGKLAYMAPEQLARERLDRRTDIFAAGIVLWELVTARRLFQGDDEISVFRQVLESKVPKPSEIVPGTDEQLDRVIMRALARDPEHRYATARDFAEALDSTCLAALPRDVGFWVEDTASDSLASRAALIAELESRPDTARAPQVALPSPSLATPDLVDTASLLAPTFVEPRAPRSMFRADRRWLWGAPAVLVLLALAVWRHQGATQDTLAVASPALTASPAPLAPPSISRPMTTSVEPTASAPLATPELLPAEPPKARKISPATSNRRAVKAAPTQPASVKRRDCDTLFVVDADGIKQPKLECL